MEKIDTTIKTEIFNKLINISSINSELIIKHCNDILIKYIKDDYINNFIVIPNYYDSKFMIKFVENNTLNVFFLEIYKKDIIKKTRDFKFNNIRNSGF